MLESLRQDSRDATRSLRRSPLFTLVAVASIAIGVGATSAIVTLANTLLFTAPPGIGNPERVVSVGRTQDGRGFDNMSYPNFVDLRAQAKTLSLAAVRIDPTNLSLAGPSGGEPVTMSMVSGNFFEVLQARPHIGRFFTMDDDRAPGSSNVVVLSHAFWRDRFAFDSTMVGKTIVLNGAPFVVAGVAAPKFQGPFVIVPDLWMPVTAATLTGWSQNIFNQRSAVWHMAIGRLKDNVSLDAAQAELAAIAARLAKDYPQENRGKGIRVDRASPFPGDNRTPIAAFMGLLFAVAGLVLVIASTNVAGMLLARAAIRQREIAVRLAVGASRGRLMRQLLVESTALFVLAGAAGLLVTRILVRGLVSLVPKLPVQLAFEPHIDWRVVAFAFGASLLTGLVAGLVPALQSTGLSLVPALKSGTGATSRRQRLRSGLLVAQISFSMLLLIVAGLFARTLTRARDIDPGFDPRDVHLASIDFSLARYDDARGVRQGEALVANALALPLVRSAALSAMLPLGGGGMGLGGIAVKGRKAPGGNDSWDCDWNVVTPRYFTTMGIPLVRGRDFSAADREGSGYVAILNQTFAENLFPGEDPIGKTVLNGDRVVTIVGIARNGKYRSLGESPRNFIYVAHAQYYVPRMTLLVKAAPGTQPQPAMRRLVAELDPVLPVLDLRSLEEQAAIGLFPQRVALYVAGSLGVVALFLALLGIYGVTAFSVAQRTREIGVRVALGADRGRVLGMVLRQGMALAGLGVAIGAVGAFIVTRLIASLLYGLPPVDAIAFGGAALLLGAAAIGASWVPARRAAAVDPVIALRTD